MVKMKLLDRWYLNKDVGCFELVYNRLSFESSEGGGKSRGSLLIAELASSDLRRDCNSLPFELSEELH